MILPILFILFYLASAMEERLAPVGNPIVQGGIPKPAVLEKNADIKAGIQKAAEVKKEAVKVEQPGFYTSDGYLVRMMKFNQPTGKRFEEPPKRESPTSSVYLVSSRRQPDASTVYQVPPSRPTLTMSSSLQTVSSKPPTMTVKGKREEDDDGADGEDEEVPPSKPVGAPKTTVQSGDPWGDFVFPTRGQRPNWMRNDAVSDTSSLNYLFYFIFPILLLII